MSGCRLVPLFTNGNSYKIAVEKRDISAVKVSSDYFTYTKAQRINRSLSFVRNMVASDINKKTEHTPCWELK